MTRLLCLFVFGCLVSCSNYGQLTFVTKLPKKVKENSGIVMLTESKIWVIEDNGNPDKMYQIDLEGNLLRELEVKNAKNTDWEDLAKDDKGNVYIGDFGNNDNRRTDLVIYKVPNPEIEKGKKILGEKIRFRYPEQTGFPPKKDSLYFDAEAFFYHKDHLFIITKNRTRPFTGEALIYSVPASTGNYEATYLGKFVPCAEQKICQVTSAAISPDGKKIAVLGYGKLWVFTGFDLKDFNMGKMKTIDLEATTQLESVCFLNNETLLLSDEQRAGTGRNLYSYSLK
ncbi:hypothetical protein [Spongiimicrobium sp. 2-473A-2-J]|uniref:hypothetical protein n=1 Tax=Eudoraea algarum TaxID=3417568 RepID=UPI003D3614BE